MRVGIGYDIHRFDSARGPLMLGGVRIPHPRSLAGHSDADVLLHAIADALLGAIGAPDLGELFPPSNPTYKGMQSRWFVQQAYKRVRQGGWRVGNVDATVVADAPKLTPYKTRMRVAISQLLKVSASDVSVKAKTTEGLSPGRQGMAAHVVVLLEQATREPRRETRGRARTRTKRR